ncbi:hypothetical protein GTQ34_14650 [Muricauda sp. JGD-17]|uniref:Uncharacterized protein n=1 Tax=Flagellimonas ochracea TaxID=2696472 RepID=A0A964TE46_9FLAO|nr:DUF6768 family protein [Allomuricauda ochracea]NAY93152.1 hypothetical protein [Allomuricauda ochracea]
MKDDSKKIDELIKEALTEEEARFYDELGEQNVLEKFEGVFKGRMGWLSILMNFWILVFFVLLVYCAVQFFGAETTEGLVTWGVGVLVCSILVSMLKLYIWMQMDKNDILRELKRLELQVSALSHKK